MWDGLAQLDHQDQQAPLARQAQQEEREILVSLGRWERMERRESKVVLVHLDHRLASHAFSCSPSIDHLH